MRTLAVDWQENVNEEAALETFVQESNPSWTEETEETEEIEETDVVGEEVGRAVEAAINACALPSFNTSNRFLFDLARRIRGIEQQHTIRFAPSVLRSLFDHWENENRHYLRSNHDYFAEFLIKLATVRQPHGVTLAAALEAAYSQSPPQRVEVLEDPDAHRVASLCRELQHRAGNEPFYLIGRSCAELIGRPHSTVAGWLCAFRTLGVLQVVEQGRQGRGSRYRYIGALTSSPAYAIEGVHPLVSVLSREGSEQNERQENSRKGKRRLRDHSVQKGGGGGVEGGGGKAFPHHPPQNKELRACQGADGRRKSEVPDFQAIEIPCWKVPRDDRRHVRHF